jgi:hypothetical protein
MAGTIPFTIESMILAPTGALLVTVAPANGCSMDNPDGWGRVWNKDEGKRPVPAFGTAYVQGPAIPDGSGRILIAKIIVQAELPKEAKASKAAKATEAALRATGQDPADWLIDAKSGEILGKRSAATGQPTVLAPGVSGQQVQAAEARQEEAAAAAPVGQAEAEQAAALAARVGVLIEGGQSEEAASQQAEAELASGLLIVPGQAGPVAEEAEQQAEAEAEAEAKARVNAEAAALA